MMRRLLLLLLLALLGGTGARAEHIVGTAAAAPSGARCRLFVLATAAETRFVLAERGGAEQDAVTLLDTFAPAAPALGATALEDAYAALRPAFLHAQELLLARTRPLQLEPRHCHAHVLATGAAAETQATHLDALFARVHQESIEDAQFPFLLAKDDLRRVDAETQSYFLAIGANFLDGRVPPSLSPGNEELHGVLSFDADAAHMTFDVLERWRRSKRQKHLPLNTTDFFIREYAGHGRKAVSAAVSKQLRAKQALESDEDVLKHPCFLAGYEQGELQGTGDATACMSAIQAYVDEGNAKCPEDNFCALNGAAQPRPMALFYGAGLFRPVVAYAHAVLQTLQATDSAVEPLALPTPTLASLRAAADLVCALPFSKAHELKKVYTRQNEHACLDLCYAVVLLRAFGMRDDDARVHFASPFAASATSAQHLSEDEATWLTGAFQYLEAIQLRKAFVMEAELLAVQVDEGLPIGFHLSLALFVAAAGFLFATTGSRSPPPPLAGSRRRPSTVTTAAAAAKQRSTHAILFVDDSSE